MLLISEELETVIYYLGLTILSDQRRLLREVQDVRNDLEYQLLLNWHSIQSVFLIESSCAKVCTVKMILIITML